MNYSLQRGEMRSIIGLWSKVGVSVFVFKESFLTCDAAITDEWIKKEWNENITLNN